MPKEGPQYLSVFVVVMPIEGPAGCDDDDDDNDTGGDFGGGLDTGLFGKCSI